MIECFGKNSEKIYKLSSIYKRRHAPKLYYVRVENNKKAELCVNKKMGSAFILDAKVNHYFEQAGRHSGVNKSHACPGKIPCSDVNHWERHPCCRHPLVMCCCKLLAIVN